MTVTRSVWGFIEQRDHRLMRRMNRWRAPRWIRYWMVAATRMGDGWLWYALGAMLVVYGGPQRFAAIGAAGVSAICGIFVFKLLKQLSQRPRPCHLEPHCWSKVLPPDKPFYLYPQIIEMHFLPPVESENISAKDLKTKVFRMMWDYYEANR